MHASRRDHAVAVAVAFVIAWLSPVGGNAVAAPPSDGAAQAAPAHPLKRVDINSASRAELKTLPGIGDAEAERIVAARPYPSKAKLAADQVLSMDTYRALKGRIVAVPKKAATQAPTPVKAEARAAGKS